MKSMLIHEWKMMVKSKKNVLFVMALVVLILSYCFIFLPNKETNDTFDPEKAKQQIQNLEAVQKGKKARGATGFSTMSGRAVYAENEYSIKLLSKLVTSYEDGDFVRFAHLKLLDFLKNGVPTDEKLLEQSIFLSNDYQFAFNQTTLRYQGYLEEELPVTYEMIEQKTALQTIQNILLGTAVLGIIFVAIYFSSDMLTRDRQNKTVLQGLPIGWYRLINIKSFVSFSYTIIILAALLVIASIVLTILNGFGSFDIRVPITLPRAEPEYGFSFNQYDTISLGKFLMKGLAFFFILIYLFIRLNAMLGLLFKNAWLVLMVSTVLLFSELIYFSRTTNKLFGIDISNFPQTYFEFGKIISGEKMFLVNVESITYGKGLIVLAITLLIIEIALYVTSRFITKRRFYHGV